MFCGKCGERLDDNAKFCTKCGNLVNENSKAEQVKPETEKYKKIVNGNSKNKTVGVIVVACLLYTSPSPRDISGSRMPSSA